MKKFAHAIAVAAALTAGSTMAAESSEWGAWASTDSDALMQIIAANHDLDARSNPRLGPEDSAALDAGGLLSSLTANLDLSDPAIVAALNTVLDTTGIDVGGNVETLTNTITTTVCGLVACP